MGLLAAKKLCVTAYVFALLSVATVTPLLATNGPASTPAKETCHATSLPAGDIPKSPSTQSATQAADSATEETAASHPASAPALVQKRPKPSSAPSPQPKAGQGDRAEKPASTKVWKESRKYSEVAAEGSIELCEAITLPLILVPAVGETIGLIAEWACILPGVMAVDYVETHHGHRNSYIWQAAVALGLAKAFRDLIKYPGIALAVGMAVGFVGMAVPALVLMGAAASIPVGLAGLVSSIGIGYIVFRLVRNKGSDLIFEGVYNLLTSDFESPAQQQQAQQEALVQPPLNAAGRAWALLAATAGAEPDSELVFVIPVYGTYKKSVAKGEMIKECLRKTSVDVLKEKRSFTDVDATAETFAVIEGLLGASGQALLLGGTVMFLAGTGFAAYQYQNTRSLDEYAVVLSATGIAGTVSASTGLSLILIREIVEAIRTVTVPAVYGLFPPDQENEEAGKRGQKQ